MKKRLFKHFVVVKFDYPENYPHLPTKKQQLRWVLLESLRNQTNTNFVLVFNSTMPIPHEGFGEIIISPCWKDKVKDAAKDYEYIITTRLDGDDFVTKDFIQTIQDAFEEKDKLVLEFNGWVYETRVKKLVRKWTFPNYVMNSFSFVEKSDNVETCYVRAHGKMKSLYEVKWTDKKIHIWCINEESLRASFQKPEQFVKNFEDERENLFKLDEMFPEIIRRIDIFNERIKKDLEIINGKR